MSFGGSIVENYERFCDGFDLWWDVKNTRGRESFGKDICK